MHLGKEIIGNIIAYQIVTYLESPAGHRILPGPPLEHVSLHKSPSGSSSWGGACSDGSLHLGGLASYLTRFSQRAMSWHNGTKKGIDV